MATSKIFVIGGTGAQGMPVVRALVADKNYSVRVLSRDPNSRRAKELLESAQQSLAEVGNADELAHCEISLADAEKALGHWDEAVAHAERALGLLGTEPRIQSVTARVTLAEIYGECLQRTRARGLDILARLGNTTYGVARAVLYDRTWASRLKAASTGSALLPAMGQAG